MSLPRFPLIPTVVVMAAVATMIALGFWQLGRKGEKEALIARYDAAMQADTEVPFPLTGEGEGLLFHRSTVDCLRVLSVQPTSGRSAAGESGWAQRASCEVYRGEAPVTVDIGWKRDPQPAQWQGGEVAGIIAPGPRLIASEAVAPDLQPLAAPSPDELPNNHLAYAGQWFFFALAALVIYVLALKRQQRGSGG